VESEESQAFAIVFGQVLLRVRKDKELSQAQLAAAVGVVQTTISRIEAGSLDVPMALLRGLSEALGVSPEALVARAEEVFKKTKETASHIQPEGPVPQADLRGLASFVVSSTWEPL